MKVFLQSLVPVAQCLGLKMRCRMKENSTEGSSLTAHHFSSAYGYFKVKVYFKNMSTISAVINLFFTVLLSTNYILVFTSGQMKYVYRNQLLK